MDNQKTNPFSSQGSANPVINLSEKGASDIGTETIKYSIRTMAQDLERARKEGLPSVAASIKPPTIPPPPPPKVSVPKPATPAAPIPPKPPVITPPAIKPIAETPAKAPIMPVAPAAPAVRREPVSTPVSPPSIPPPTIKREIPPPAELPVMPKPSITTAIPPSAIPTPSPIKKPAILPAAKKFLLPSLPQLNILIGIAAVVIILFGSVGFSYWWFFIKQAPIIKPQPTEQIPPVEKTPVAAEPNLPEKISQTDMDIIIGISTKTPSPETTSSLLDQISSSTKKLSDKQLGRILIKYSTQTEKSYLPLSESLALLQIKIPDNINSNIKNGELLAYNQNGQFRYGFTAAISSTLSMIDAMKIWEKTIIDDLNNLFISSSPVKPNNPVFQDDFQDNFIIRYLNLPTSTLSMAWAESNEKQIFIVTTSKDMMYKIIGVKEPIKQVLKTYPSGTLIKTKNDDKIYRIIDDKKLWVPTIKAFLDSGYKPYSEVEITQEELSSFANARYVKTDDNKNVYELRDDKKYLLPDIASLPQQEIKLVTPAELNAYPLGK